MITIIAIAAISLAISIINFFFCRWYIARKTSRLLSDYRSEVDRMIADIDAATDRDMQLVEERILSVRKVLEDTDRRIAVYLRETQRQKEDEAMYASLGRGIRAALDSSPVESILARPPASESQPEPPSPPPAKKRESKKRQAPAEAATKPLFQAEEKMAKEPGPHTGAPAEKMKTKEQIAHMASQGLAPAAIASSLGISLAEVDLALNLLYHPADKKTSFDL